MSLAPILINVEHAEPALNIPVSEQTSAERRFLMFPGDKENNHTSACCVFSSEATRMLLAIGRDVYAAPAQDSILHSEVRPQVEYCKDGRTVSNFNYFSGAAESGDPIASVPNGAFRFYSLDGPIFRVAA